MSLTRRYVDAASYRGPADPTAIPPAPAAKVRIWLKELVLIRDTHRDLQGQPVAFDPDRMNDTINAFEAFLRPRYAGLLR